MNTYIKNAIEKGNCILFFGAGASVTSKNSLNESLPTGNKLKEILATEANITLDEDDSLSNVYDTAKKYLGTAKLESVLNRYLKNCLPSDDYITIAKFPFPRIYTLNIDDSFENAIRKSGNVLKVFGRNDRVEDFNVSYQETHLIKLNGDINNPRDEFIFSIEDYANAAYKEPIWYSELARDFHRYTFVFIGTKLNEPLFYQQIKKYRSYTKDQNGKSFLVLPTLSEAQKQSLDSNNIEYIEGSLSDFSVWLNNEFPNGISPIDILKKNTQGLNFIVSDDSKRLKVFKDVIGVSRASISIEEEGYKEVKDFYKGYKPSWDDILRGVTALLHNTRGFFDTILKNKNSNNLFVILGSAGTGKSTAIKQISLMLSEEQNSNVYYTDGSHENIKELVRSLNDKNDGKYFLCIDRIANLAVDIDEILSSIDGTKVIFIGTENLKIWNSRVIEHLHEHNPMTKEFEVISYEDVDLILDKLKEYGHWTRLEKMPLYKRRKELYTKAKKQLLIGLLEATSGDGFENIIKKDYNLIIKEEEKVLLIISGIASMHRSEASVALASRTLSYLNIERNIHDIIYDMRGIVNNINEYLTSRHRIYFERLAYKFISKDLLKKVVIAYIRAYSVYKFPIVKNISKKDSQIYKGIVNFKFLKKLFNDSGDYILDIYKVYEKELEHEGLFLLQYGLALRAFNKQDEALNKLIQAREAYPDSAHIEHAYAHQLLILSDIASGELDKEIALDYLDKAKETLKNIKELNKKLFDSYPIVTLSVYHIKILHKLGMIDEAERQSKDYFNQLKSLFPHIGKTENSSINKTKRFLMNYYTSGKLEELNYEDEYDYDYI